MEDHYGTDDVADAIADRRRGILNRHFIAAPGNEYRVFGERNDTAFLEASHNRVVDGRARVLVDDRHDIDDGLAARATHVPPRQVLRHRIDVIDTAVGVSCDHAVADGLQRDLRTLLFLENAGFRMFAVGDIGDRSFVRDNVAIVIVNGAPILQNDNFLAVLAPQPVLEVLDESLGLETSKNALAVDRIDVQHRGTAGCLQILHAVETEHFDERGIRGNKVAVARGDIHPVDDVFEQAPVAGLGTAETIFVQLPLDRDTCKSRHAAEFVELVRRWTAWLGEVNIQCAYHAAGCTVKQERPGSTDTMLFGFGQQRRPARIPRNVVADAVTGMIDGGAAGNAVLGNRHEIQHQL